MVGSDLNREALQGVDCFAPELDMFNDCLDRLVSRVEDQGVVALLSAVFMFVVSASHNQDLTQVQSGHDWEKSWREALGLEFE